MPAFDLRKTLKQISPTLRRQLFTSSWPALNQLDWKSVQKKTKVDAIFDGLQELPSNAKRDIQMLLRTFLDLIRPCSLKVLLEELQQEAPELVDQWGEIQSRMDKVVWTYLNARKAFEDAVIFARADSFSKSRYWKRWSAVPGCSFSATEDRIEALKAALVEHHIGEFRGDHCEIHPYTRKNGAEYFFAYLPDWPEDFMVFNRNGELESLDLPTAFNILFVFNSKSGKFEMMASGGIETLNSLRRCFYKAMTGSDVEDAPPDRTEYELDHILEDGFAFTGHDTGKIEKVSVTRLLVCPLIEGQMMQGFQARIRRGSTWRAIIEQLDALLTSMNLSRDQVTVDELCIAVQCVSEATRRGRSFTIRVTPRACDLKSLDDDELRVLGEDCLVAWRIDRE